jgi:hypothetical protein
MVSWLTMPAMETTNVFLDTEVFVRAYFNYQSKPFRILTALAQTGQISLYLTDVTHREVRAHIKETVIRAGRAQRQFAKVAGVLRNSALPELTGRLQPIDENRLESELLEQLQAFLERTRATVLETSAVEVGPVLSAYFEVLPPFGTGDKKAEFLDAFALAALRDFCEKAETGLYVVSGDSLLREACRSSNGLFPLETLPAFLDLAATDDDQLAAFLRREIMKREDEVTPQIRDAFENLGFLIQDQDGDVNEVRVLEVDFDHEIEILQVSDGTAEVQTTVWIEFEADLTYNDLSTASWDSEDQRYFFHDTVEETVARKDNCTVEITVEFAGLDPEFFEVVAVSIADPKGSVVIASSAG